MRFIKSGYAKFAKWVNGSGLIVYSDVVILASSGYLLTKKAFDFSLSAWLAENWLKQDLVNLIVLVGAFVIISSIIIKSVSLITKKYSYPSHEVATPDMISECLQAINTEISLHIQKCETQEKQRLRQLKDEHRFNVNLRLIVSSLSEQIKQSISTIHIKKRDIFISLYHFVPDENCLKYELHFDHKKDLVKSKVIPLDEERFEKYECVKCMNSVNSTIYALEKKHLAKGHSKRSKSVKHYMGCKLQGLNYNFGFLNIEFHNQTFFSSEEEMHEFMEDNIFPFKQLMEYQYLKREFFGKFEDLEAHWETA